MYASSNYHIAYDVLAEFGYNHRVLVTRIVTHLLPKYQYWEFYSVLYDWLTDPLLIAQNRVFANLNVLHLPV